MIEKSVQPSTQRIIFSPGLRRAVMALLALVAALFLALPRASANSVTITYYTISSSDPDANHLAGGVFSNEVQALLGPDGLPVLNTAAFGCTSGCYSPIGAPTNLTAGGEITYWSPTLNPYVTQTGTAVVSLPFSVPSNFFPPNGTGSFDGGTNGFQAALLSGNLIVPANTSESISFNIGADDMAFAYLDGQVVCDLGGVHASTSGTCTTATIGAGSHSLDVFFVDINQVQSGLTFGVNTSNITTTPGGVTPEPGTLTLLGFGLLGIGFAVRRAG
ncbi:MAG TPA: PEP-CTERM sorting domain-containing protein [Candidatus Acidoferrales bacterium]|nr:PEP-CTERM sorting domain-containing protein [Candidatus Acidoferrales bacterium]